MLRSEGLGNYPQPGRVLPAYDRHRRSTEGKLSESQLFTLLLSPRRAFLAKTQSNPCTLAIPCSLFSSFCAPSAHPSKHSSLARLTVCPSGPFTLCIQLRGCLVSTRPPMACRVLCLQVVPRIEGGSVRVECIGLGAPAARLACPCRHVRISNRPDTGAVMQLS